MSEIKWWEEHPRLWKKLVPKSGQAATVQGELIAMIAPRPLFLTKKVCAALDALLGRPIEDRGDVRGRRLRAVP